MEDPRAGLHRPRRGSATWYFAPRVAGTALGGLVFLGSVLVGRPLAGVFATDSDAFPPVVRTSATFAQVFGRISLVWAAYVPGRAAWRLALLPHTSIEAFLVVSVLTGLPLSGALMTWSFWYSARKIRPLFLSAVAR